MRAFEWITAIYFTYVLALAWTLGLPAARRWRVTGTSTAVCVALATTTAGLPRAFDPLRDWLPGLYLVAAYELSGLFFQEPMIRFEGLLARVDRQLFRRLDADGMVARAPRALLEYFEAAYLSAVPLVPAGLLVMLWSGGSADVDRFWTLVLIVEFTCFGMLPWIQTRPPWAIEPPGSIDRRTLAMRRLNRQIVDRVLMPVNTFPSGHAATALAIALAVMPGAPSAGWAFLLVAFSVAVGSVVGRYHYTLDAAAGFALTLLVWGAARVWGT